MNYLRFGTSKKFIFFLHGWGGDLTSFLWIREHFEDEYSLVFVDFAGFGKSPEPKEAFFVSDYVLELKKLIDIFDVDELILIGHSFGGRVAIKYSYLFCEEYKKLVLVLVDSAGVLPRRSLMYYVNIFRYKRLKKKARYLEKYKVKLERFGSKDYKALDGVMRQTFVNIVNEDLSNNARFVKCKTLIVWGSKDRETKPYMARKLNRLIKGSKLKIIDNAGHFCFLEKKEEFVIILDTFLKNIDNNI